MRIAILLMAAGLVLPGCASNPAGDSRPQQFNYHSTLDMGPATGCVADKLRMSKMVSDVKRQQMDVNVYRVTAILVDQPNSVEFHISPNKGGGAHIDVTVNPPIPNIKKLLLDGTADAC